jgi:hypothetical protein
MFDDSFDHLPESFRECEQRLLRWCQETKEPDDQIAALQDEAVHCLGQARWCLNRIQEIEREGQNDDFELDHAGSEGIEIEVLTEGWYNAAFRFLKLCPKLNLPGFPRKQPALDLVIVRNWLMEHTDHPEFGVRGRHFGYELPGGPHVKPFANTGKLPNQRGLYHHASELLNWLRAKVEFLETYQSGLGD